MTDSKVDFEVKTFEQQEKELDDENKKSQEIKKKAPIKDVIKNSSLDYHAGKALVHEKKDEVYHPHEYEEESNDYSSLHDHPEGIKRYSNPNLDSNNENHLFHDNIFWPKNNGFVDEVELDDLISSMNLN